MKEIKFVSDFFWLQHQLIIKICCIIYYNIFFLNYLNKVTGHKQNKQAKKNNNNEKQRTVIVHEVHSIRVPYTTVVTTSRRCTTHFTANGSFFFVRFYKFKNASALVGINYSLPSHSHCHHGRAAAPGVWALNLKLLCGKENKIRGPLMFSVRW